MTDYLEVVKRRGEAGRISNAWKGYLLIGIQCLIALDDDDKKVTSEARRVW